MPARAGLYVTALLVVGGLVLGSVLRGQPPSSPSEWLSPIGPSVALAAAALWLFDRWAWRQIGIRRLVRRPVLHGTWHGEITPKWIDPRTNKTVESDTDVFLVIRQTFWSISVRLLTNESTSKAVHAELVRDGDGVCELVYVYSNKPQSSVSHRSKQHHGAVVISAPRNGSDGIEGNYFTDRKTVGDMRFHKHFSRLIETHSAGLGLVGGDGSHDLPAKPAP